MLQELENENDLYLQSKNVSLPYSSYDFIDNNRLIAIPYLTFISGLTFIGTFGNMLVLGTLLIVKVRILCLIILDLTFLLFLNTFKPDE